MGCVHSRANINDLHPNMFHVMNVDDLGNLIAPGQLEITDLDIILYQRGKHSVRWPLRCLRRYGYDAEIFSFESGRRCSTGPGIYAFKCRRAEQLFNLVQTNIQVIFSAIISISYLTFFISSRFATATATIRYQESFLPPIHRRR